MSLREYVDFQSLENAAEDLVIDELERQLEGAIDPKIPRNAEAVLDMAAYALNIVKPMYRVNLLGRLYTGALQAEYGGIIRSAVREAIDRISSNPPGGG
jgi:competence protein ComFB